MRRLLRLSWGEDPVAEGAWRRRTRHALPCHLWCARTCISSLPRVEGGMQLRTPLQVTSAPRWRLQGTCCPARPTLSKHTHPGMQGV